MAADVQKWLQMSGMMHDDGAALLQLSGEDMSSNKSAEALKAVREGKAGRGWLGGWRGAGGKDSSADARAEAKAEAKASKEAKKAEKLAAKQSCSSANLQSSSPPGTFWGPFDRVRFTAAFEAALSAILAI